MDTVIEVKKNDDVLGFIRFNVMVWPGEKTWVATRFKDTVQTKQFDTVQEAEQWIKEK